MNTEPYTACWRTVQKVRKQMLLKEEYKKGNNKLLTTLKGKYGITTIDVLRFWTTF